MNDLVLLKTANFNGIVLDCYKGDDKDEFWATREQIGRLLEYEYPKNFYRKNSQTQ